MATRGDGFAARLAHARAPGGRDCPHTAAMRIALCVAFAGCSSSPPHAVALPLAPIPPDGQRPAQRYTRIELGTARGHATRTTFELTWSGDRGSLLEIDEQDPRSLRVADADRDPRWRLAGTHHYRGIRRAACDGCAGFAVDLDAPDVQPLHLRCEPRTIDVAPSSAIPAPPATDPCDPGVRQPAAKIPTAVLVCGTAAQDVSDGDPDDQLVFAAAPGVEWIDENDGCATNPQLGLRLAYRR